MSSNAPEKGSTPQDPPQSRITGSGISLNIDYVKSIPGILTVVITVVSLISFICVYAGGKDPICQYFNGASFTFFGFVSMTAFLTGLVIYIIFLLSLNLKLSFIPWSIAILIWCGVWAFFFLIASSLTAAKACGQSAVVAGGVFGLLVMVLFAIRAFFAFMEIRDQRSRGSGSGSGSQPSSNPPPEYTTGSDFVQY